MGDLSIKIKIADREYPMKVPPEEEESIRIAGKLLNEKLKFFQEQFGRVDDRQDLFAMVALDCMIENLQIKDGQKQRDQFLEQKVKTLNGLLNDSLR